MDRVVQLSGKIALDNYQSLPNTISWSLLGTRWGGRPDFRPNPPIREGQMRSVHGTLYIDTRNKTHNPHRGWFTTLSAEKAGGFLQGDFNFERYLLDLRRYQPIAMGTRLDIRLRLSTARGDIPNPFQYALGGSGSLHGYDYKVFSGDRMGLFNLAYWIDGKRHFDSDWPLDDVSVGAFFDAGTTWFANDVNNPIDGIQSVDQIIKRSVGVALQLEDLHAYIARPLDADDPSWRVWFRFSRAF